MVSFEETPFQIFKMMERKHFSLFVELITEQKNVFFRKYLKIKCFVFLGYIKKEYLLKNMYKRNCFGFFV